METNLMTSHRRFRILTPEGRLSGDTFVLPPEQPSNLKVGCTLVIHERSGKLFTVHDARLFPAEAAGAVPAIDTFSVEDLDYDHAQGVIEIRLNCSGEGGNSRGVGQADASPPPVARPFSAPLMYFRQNLVGCHRRGPGRPPAP
jgi:hypothetical protein